MNEIAFTVIIPLYNKERHIARAIESVLSQTHSNYELIIIDDGSTDRSLNEAHKYLSEKIFIFSNKNEGAASARNFGIHRASNELIAFLDADDTWDQDYLRVANDAILSFPANTFYFSPISLVYSEVKSLGNCSANFPVGFVGTVNYFEVGFSPNPTSLIARKSHILKFGGFDTTLCKGEDLDLWIKLALINNNKAVLINSIHSKCYLNSDNRAMNKVTPKHNSLINNLGRFEQEEKINSSLRLYLDSSRVQHLRNFYANLNSEVSDATSIFKQILPEHIPFDLRLARIFPKRVRRFAILAYLKLSGITNRLKSFKENRE